MEVMPQAKRWMYVRELGAWSLDCTVTVRLGAGRFATGRAHQYGLGWVCPGGVLDLHFDFTPARHVPNDKHDLYFVLCALSIASLS